MPFSEHNSVLNPAATFQRGQKTTIKYQRNNHGPGGFIRLTLVRPEHMMNKNKHAANAFYYTCWGANPVVAAPDELHRDDYGFTLIGSDGEEHDYKQGYYQTEIEIPKCVPDGDYVLGWAWYGGMSTPVKGNVQQEPSSYGYFGDYWSCSFVRIQGGSPISSSCQPVFKNDMSAYSSAGCMSSVDEPGPCTYEPCKVRGKYQKPKPFKNGPPKPLTPNHFKKAGNYPKFARTKACKCLSMNWYCDFEIASKTLGLCKGYTETSLQPDICKNACCDVCQIENPPHICRSKSIRNVCHI